MYLQENIVYDFDCDIKVTWNIAKHPLHHVTYATAFTRKYTIWPLFVCLHFTFQVNSYGHGRTVSSPNHTFSWAGLQAANK